MAADPHNNNAEQEANDNHPPAPHADADAPAQIRLRFVDANDNETFFKVRKTTKMKKAMDAYAQNKGMARDTLRFLFEGNRILDDDTPDKLAMEDEDKVDVFIEQLGGGAEGAVEV